MSQPLPWKGVLRGREYPGEVLYAREWHPALAQLPPGCYFRLVFLSRGGRLPAQALEEPRLVFFQPREGVVGEAREGYGPLPEAPSPYISGEMFSRLPLPLTAADAFSSGGWEEGLGRVASALLASYEGWQWNRLLPYIRQFSPGAREVGSSQEVGGQARGAVEGVERLKAELERVGSGLAGVGWEAEGEVALSLRRLARLPQPSLLELLHSLPLTYFSPDDLTEDLARLRSLLELLPALPQVQAARHYLGAASPQEPQLSMDRLSLLEQFTPATLLESPQLWPSLSALFSLFQGRYREVYADFHRRYHREMAELKQHLEQAEPRVRALRLLNSIPELGEGVGLGLAEQYQALGEQVVPCPLGDGEIPADAPLCPACSLKPPASPPTAQVQGLLQALEQALGEQQRRLSSQAVRQLLRRRGEGKLDTFLKVLRAGDPTPLVNILNQELVDFLRQLLAEEEVVVVRADALRQLREAYPELSEGEVEALLARLRRSLRQAFRKAQREHPGKTIRLSLE